MCESRTRVMNKMRRHAEGYALINGKNSTATMRLNRAYVFLDNEKNPRN
jgi:hypothetical protein